MFPEACRSGDDARRAAERSRPALRADGDATLTGFRKRRRISPKGSDRHGHPARHPFRRIHPPRQSRGYHAPGPPGPQGSRPRRGGGHPPHRPPAQTLRHRNGHDQLFRRQRGQEERDDPFAARPWRPGRSGLRRRNPGHLRPRVSPYPGGHRAGVPGRAHPRSLGRRHGPERRGTSHRRLSLQRVFCRTSPAGAGTSSRRWRKAGRPLCSTSPPTGSSTA